MIGEGGVPISAPILNDGTQDRPSPSIRWRRREDKTITLQYWCDHRGWQDVPLWLPNDPEVPPMVSHREFLAFLFYSSDSDWRDEIPCRWGTPRDDLKEKWLNVADTRLAMWLVDEDAAKKCVGSVE
jgi:hypothetical protein